MEAMGVSLGETAVSRFVKYFDMMIETNKVMNLTGLTDPVDVIDRHYVDSLGLVKAVDPSGLRIIDVGTGAGFPGIPLKIVYPDTEIVLLDSLQKRVGFLNDVIDELELDGICAIHSRAEEAGRDEDLRESFDLCVSRAVSALPVLTELCLPFVRVGGKFVSYKSGEVDEEILSAGKAISVLGGEKVDVNRFELPGTDISRSLVVVNKTVSTPSKYPRRPGIPEKKPIF